MAADTPLAITLAASVADAQCKDNNSAADAVSYASSEPEEEGFGGGSLMDAYKELLSSQVSNFDADKKESSNRKHFRFDDWNTCAIKIWVY